MECSVSPGCVSWHQPGHGLVICRGSGNAARQRTWRLACAAPDRAWPPHRGRGRLVGGGVAGTSDSACDPENNDRFVSYRIRSLSSLAAQPSALRRNASRLPRSYDLVVSHGFSTWRRFHVAAFGYEVLTAG